MDARTLQNKINYSYLMEFLTALFVSQLQLYNFDIIILEKLENLKTTKQNFKRLCRYEGKPMLVLSFAWVCLQLANGQFH